MKLVIFTLLVGAIMADDTDPASTAQSPGAGFPFAWAKFGDRSFASVPNVMGWCAAQKLCMTGGGSLASIRNELEYNFVSTLAAGQRAWIGFSDAQNETDWLWINSDPSTYTNWCEGHPDHPGENQNCALINFSVNSCWDNQDCSTPYPSVCSKEN